MNVNSRKIEKAGREEGIQRVALGDRLEECFEIGKIYPLNFPSNPFYFLNLLFFRVARSVVGWLAGGLQSTFGVILLPRLLGGLQSTSAQPMDFTSKTLGPDLERPTTHNPRPPNRIDQSFKPQTTEPAAGFDWDPRCSLESPPMNKD